MVVSVGMPEILRAVAQIERGAAVLPGLRRHEAAAPAQYSRDVKPRPRPSQQ
jgi:hypothetical protein